MKITPTMRKRINAAVRSMCGTNPLAEVRISYKEGDQVGVNGLNWLCDADLHDLVRLADLREIDDCADLPNCATLDLYITSGVGMARELETNVYVTIKDGEVASVHSNDLQADAITLGILGRPFSKQSR